MSYEDASGPEGRRQMYEAAVDEIARLRAEVDGFVRVFDPDGQNVVYAMMEAQSLRAEVERLRDAPVPVIINDNGVLTIKWPEGNQRTCLISRELLEFLVAKLNSPLAPLHLRAALEQKP